MLVLLRFDLLDRPAQRVPGFALRAAPAVALTEAYQRASVVSALLSVAAAIVAAVLLRRAERPPPDRVDDDIAVTTHDYEVARP